MERQRTRRKCCSHHLKSLSTAKQFWLVMKTLLAVTESIYGWAAFISRDLNRVGAGMSRPRICSLAGEVAQTLICDPTARITGEAGATFVIDPLHTETLTPSNALRDGKSSDK